MGSANIKHVCKVNPSLSIPYTGRMFSAFEFYGMQSRTTCYSLLCRSSFKCLVRKYTVLPLCVLCIDRLGASWFDCIHTYIHSIVTENSLVQKWKYGIRRHEKKETRKKGRNEERTPALVRNKDWCFQVRVYNGCCVALHNKKFEGANMNIHLVHTVFILILFFFFIIIMYNNNN
jgi:hypothetical protein